MGKVIGKEACPACQRNGRDSAGDNLGVFEDGGGYCIACGYHRPGDGSGEPVEGQRQEPTGSSAGLPPAGEYMPLADRRITEETCRKYRYTVDDKGNHLAYYQRSGQWAYCHTRTPSKDFWGTGQRQGVELFGQHLFQARKGGNMLTITEGELDALAGFQIMKTTSGYENAVVSICGGVNNAVNNIRDNYEYVSSFETIILAFDADQPGQAAAKAVADILPPGKVKIMVHPPGLKDACDYLKHHRETDWVNAWWAAKVYRPDGIVHVSEVSTDRSKKAIHLFRDRQLTERFIGREAGELVAIGSGSGMGKSTWVRLQIEDDLKRGLKVGVVALEETTQDTLYELASLRMGKPVRKILGQRRLREIDPTLNFDIPDDLDDAALEAHLKALQKQPLFLYDHKGSLDSRNLIQKLRHLAVGCGCQILYIDHITLAVAGGEGDERKDIDALMKALVSLKEETGCVIMLVSQFTRPSNGKPYEEGAETHANSFRGSGSIYQASDIAIGLERNQQAPTDMERATVTIRSLKARRSGFTGPICIKYYDKASGRLEDDWKPPVPFATREQQRDFLETFR